MIVVDITADLNDEDETGFIWTFRDEARDPSMMVPGAIVVAGDPESPAVVEVVDVVDKPAGTAAYVTAYSGRQHEDYAALVRRTFVTT